MNEPDRCLSLLREFASSLSSLLPGLPRVHAVLGFTIRGGQQVRVVLRHPGGSDELARAFVPSTSDRPCVLTVLGDRTEAVGLEGLKEALRAALSPEGLLAARMTAWRAVLTERRSSVTGSRNTYM